MRQQTVSQLKREIDLYLTLPKPVDALSELSDLLKIIYTFFLFSSNKVEVIQWWKQQQNSLPDLPEDFFCPLSSTSSERMFSASGNIVSISRMNLTPETASTLTYV